MLKNQIIDNLQKGETYEAFVIDQSLEEPKEMRLFFTQFNKRLKDKGIVLRLIAPQNMKKVFEEMYGKEFMKSYFEIRYTKQIIPVGITIYNDNIITDVVENEKPISLKITNAKLPLNYKNYFYFLWNRN